MFLVALLTSVGLLAHLLAWRCKLPLVVVMLGLGTLLQSLLGLPTPQLHSILTPLVGLAVAMVYFEGGCALAAQPLGETKQLVGHLAAIGPKLGWLLISALAALILGLSSLMALTCGALLLISAPYSIEPLVIHLGGDERLSRALYWECFLVSCIAVAWTVLMGNAVVENGGHPSLLVTLVATTRTGLTGVILAYAMTYLLKRWYARVPEEFRQPLCVSVALMAYGLSQALIQGAGLVAAITMGYLVGLSGEVLQEPRFWSSMRILTLGGLGVFLGMLVPLSDLALGWPRDLLFSLALMVVVRPLLVALGSRKHKLAVRDRIILSLVAPRGILTLAVAALLTDQFVAVQHPEAERLLPAAYWVILMTSLGPWLVGPWLVRRDGYSPSAA